MECNDLPIINLSTLDLQNTDRRMFKEKIILDLAKEFRIALEKYGFLYIDGHGIKQEIIDAAFQSSKEFFDPKNREIHASFYRKKGVILGYVDGLNERDLPKNPIDLKQGFDFVLDCKEFEAFPDHLKDPIRVLYKQFEGISVFIQRFLTICLELDDLDYFVKAHQKMGDITRNTSTMRILHYTSVNGEILEKQNRMSDHTDFGSFTMLLQDDVGGLQVLSPDGGHFMDVVPVKNTLIFNVGDLLHLWSGRKLKSTLHRVIIHKDITKHRSRQSIAFFTNPDNRHIMDSVDDDGNIVQKSVSKHIDERNNSTIFDVDKNGNIS